MGLRVNDFFFFLRIRVSCFLGRSGFESRVFLIVQDSSLVFFGLFGIRVPGLVSRGSWFLLRLPAFGVYRGTSHI